MATVNSSASETIPRTANLLACKQWWRVCFLHGDQEKYYRQIYGRAASQRIATSGQKQLNIGDSSNILPPFCTKQQALRRSKIFASERFEQTLHLAKQSVPPHNKNISSGRKVTVLDDPFLFGMVDHVNNSEDGRIDNTANYIAIASVPLSERKYVNDADLNRDLCNYLKINETELRLLHVRRNRFGVAINAPEHLKHPGGRQPETCNQRLSAELPSASSPGHLRTK